MMTFDVKQMVKRHLISRTERRWSERNGRLVRQNELDGPVVISLTSFPARFATLPLTLKCLLTQTVAVDCVVLWLSRADFGSITPEIEALAADGLEILQCDEDFRSYNKIVHSLDQFQGASIITADDDLYYWPRWAEELISASMISDGDVICHRAHVIRLDDRGLPTRYQNWKKNTGDTRPSRLIFPTGVGGVFYRPGILGGNATNSSDFMRLCPTADDVWLYWMASINGATFRKVGPPRAIVTWPDTQSTGLRQVNVAGEARNDAQIEAMVDTFGFKR